MIQKQDRDASGGRTVNDQQYFLTALLSYRLKVVRREFVDLRSGEICQKLSADYEGIIRELDLTVKK